MTMPDGHVRFDERRQELHTLGAELESLAQLFCPNRTDGPVHLARAKAKLDDSAVTLCVAGGEGAGKSTLIDSILGKQVVPTEDGEPGTVAPVMVQWHEAEEPAYSVLLGGMDAPVPCSNVEQFRRFTLQQFNPRNERGLVRGVVGVRHPLLADGLRLVDMPGVGGAADEINQATRLVLREAHAVLLVIRDRTSLGDITRLIADLMAHNVMVQGIVSNQTARSWRKDPQRLVTSLQAALRRQHTEAGVELPTEHIFVLHLPSIQGLETAPDAEITGAVHDTELARFRDWLAHYLDATRVDALLAEVASELAAVERAVWQALRAHRSRLTAIKKGAVAGMLSALDRAHEAFLKRWSNVDEEPGLAETIARHGSILASLLRDHGERLRAEVAGVRESLGPREGWNEKTVAKVADVLRPVVDNALLSIETSHEDAMKIVMEQLRAMADPMALELMAQAPFLLGLLDHVTVEGSVLLPFEHPSSGVEAFLEIFSDARRVDRVLAAYQALAASMSAASSSIPMRNFEDNTQHAMEAFATAFEQRIAVLRRMVEAPEPNELAEARKVLNELGESLGQLGARLRALDPVFVRDRQLDHEVGGERAAAGSSGPAEVGRRVPQTASSVKMP